MKKSILLSSILLLGITISDAQNISTIAGTGTAGYNGDGISAATAELNFPDGMGIDASGNLYVADILNNRVRLINTSTGIITTIAGNGTAGFSGDGAAATSAELYNPNSATLDAAGNIYIADELNNRIRKINTSGIISTIAGNGTGGYNGDGIAATSAELYAPGSIAIDKTGNIYIADYKNNRIRKVNTSGVISTIAGTGTAGYNGDGIAATTAELSAPIGVAVDQAGNVIVTDNANNRIREINVSTGLISTIAGNGTAAYGGDGGPATSAMLDWPTRVFLDKFDNIFIADWGNGCIRLINNAGVIYTLAGNAVQGFSGDGSLATSAELNHPAGVVVDAGSNIYIDDEQNHRVRKVSNVTGINEVMSIAEVSVYPNPAKQTLFVKYESTTSSTVLNVIDLLGSIVLSQNMGTGKNTANVDISALSTGVYFLKIISDKNTVVTKFIKE